VMPSSGLKPSAAVVVATLRAIVAQGDGKLSAGLANLGQHLNIVRNFGVPAVVAINCFPNDTLTDLTFVRDYCLTRGVECGLSEVFDHGAIGGLDVAEKVIAAANSGTANPQPLYQRELPLDQKVETIARRIYGADGVQFSDAAKMKLDHFANLGFGHFPVCIAKTPLSFTDDPKRLGAPTGWTLPITDFVVSAGAEFVVAIAGTTVRMPGLGKHPQAFGMDLGRDGEMIGVV